MTPPSLPAHGLTLIAASAGSGKTHHLTSLVTAAVNPALPSPIALESLVAVTYTRRAAAELETRIRRTLVTEQAHERCQELPLAYIGTVHGVCLRLSRELAIDAGLSPVLEVITGEESNVLARALEGALPKDLRDRLDCLAQQLEIGWDARIRRSNWLEPVREIMTLARSNRIAGGSLPTMAERSSNRLLELMGPAEANGDTLNADLASALQSALRELDAIDDGQQNTKAARTKIREAHDDILRGPLAWSRWIALQKVAPGKKGRAAVAPLIDVARRVDRHPHLQAALREFVTAVYEAARLGLAAHDAWKRGRRLVDFVDMVDRALTLLDIPEVRDELSARLALGVIDEFQDTSPLQLALFVRLHALTGRSTWVGDRKQCIFEYAGADPALMDAASAWVRTAGGTTTSLLDNWRSRRELVALCSHVFAAAFERHGHAAEDVVMTPRRQTPSDLDSLPPLGVFWLQTKDRAADAEAMAQGIRKLLDAPSATQIADRDTARLRDLVPADVAVLVATNMEAEQVTAALGRRGIRAAVARAGLLDTPEGTLLRAALRCTIDKRDARSRAIVDALTGFCGQDPESWLEARISEHSDWLDARENATPFDARDRPAAPGPLEALRAEVEVLAPSEAVDRILSVLDVAELAARWPDPEQRLANLDALRALASRYEAGCKQQREAASIAGLLRYFDDVQRKVRVGNEELASDDQHVSHGPNSVTVTTYHRAKGLEWPVVVLASLDRGPRRTPFNVLPVSDRTAFDPNDPLGGRWIRYFPWPYGSHEAAPLRDIVNQTGEGQSVSEREARERARLLYVGFTRARDHLILAVRSGRRGPSAKWLDELCDASGRPLLALPAPTEPDRVPTAIRGLKGRVLEVPTRVWSFTGDDADDNDGTQGDAPGPNGEPRRWFAKRSQPLTDRPSHWIAPSRAALDWPEASTGIVARDHAIGSRLPLGSERPEDWNVVGDVLHAFLAADLPALGPPQRLELARRLLEASDLLTLLAPDALLRSSDQLRRWIDGSWPNSIWHRELPVTGVLSSAAGPRRIEGTIDLLLETTSGFVLIDHKSYPGRRSTWRDKAAEYVPQLGAYAAVLRMSGRRVLSQWLSFAVAGGVVEIVERQLPRSATALLPRRDGT